MAYLLDANVLIEAKNRYYAFAFCPGFWDWVAQQKVSNQVLSVKAVGDEIDAKKDQLSTWCAGHGATLFLPPDASTLAAMPLVSATVTAMLVDGAPYTPAAIAEFFSKADYYLIAHALGHGDIVVTHELGIAHGVPAKRKRVKIPDVCDALGVNCTSPFQMLTTIGASFVLAPAIANVAAAGVVPAVPAPPPAGVGAAIEMPPTVPGTP